jgi:hypothetical protein
MESVIAFFVLNKVVIIGFLFATSEVLALIPSIESNSVFEVVVKFIKKAAGK